MSSKRQTREGWRCRMFRTVGLPPSVPFKFQSQKTCLKCYCDEAEAWNVQTMDVPGYLSLRSDLTSSNIEQLGQDLLYSAN
jgi:hypothetical protein